MTDEQFKQIKATMPWSERVYQTPRGGIVQMIDNRGMEVPLFTMTAFLQMITAKLAAQQAQKGGANE